jgi:2Fe-2S ferredoxin
MFHLSRSLGRRLPAFAYRRFTATSGSGVDASLADRLSELGIDADVHAEVVSTLASVSGKDITVSSIDAFGASGIKDLAASIQNQRPKPGAPVRQRRDITISIPHHRTEFTVNWRQGQSFMQLAQDDEVLREYIEASCSGTMACCSCHVYLDPKSFEALGGKPCVSERDMLDLAYEWKETSRLGCQVHLTDELLKLDEIVITIPAGVNNVF